MTSDIIQDIAIILLAIACILHTLYIRHIGHVGANSDQLAKNINRWVFNTYTLTFALDDGTELTMVSRPTPWGPRNDAARGGSVSIPLSALCKEGSGKGLSQNLIRSLESLERTYGPYSLELLASGALTNPSHPTWRTGAQRKRTPLAERTGCNRRRLSIRELHQLLARLLRRFRRPRSHRRLPHPRCCTCAECAED